MKARKERIYSYNMNSNELTKGQNPTPTARCITPETHPELVSEAKEAMRQPHAPKEECNPYEVARERAFGRVDEKACELADKLATATAPDWAEQLAEDLAGANLPRVSGVGSQGHSIKARKEAVLAIILRHHAAQQGGEDSRRLDWLEKNANGGFNFGKNPANFAPLSRWGIDTAAGFNRPDAAMKQEGEQ